MPNMIVRIVKWGIVSLLIYMSMCSTVQAQNDGVQVQYYHADRTDTLNVETASDIAQQQRKNEILRKIGVGGTLGLQVGSYTNVELSPEISYHFNDWVCLGVGGTYMFSHYKSYSQAYNSHVFGARGFVEAHFFNYVALHVEYEWLNYEEYGNTAERTYSHNILMGGGFYQRAGRMAYYVLLFYNLSNKAYPDNILSDFVTKAGLVVFLK